MTVHIVGAGMAGLLAANMLRHRDPIVHEIQPSLPNNHSAVLRFRTSAVGDVLNIPFKKVQMIKDHVPWRNVVADALAYSFKNSGKYRSDRSITAGQTTAERWIAPPDLIPRMAERLNIIYGQPFDFHISSYGKNDPIISTLPMPHLRRELGLADPSLQFNSVSGLNIKAKIANCDAYISLLVPDPNIPFSRISVTGDEMIIETYNSAFTKELSPEDIAARAADLLGLKYDFYEVTSHPQKYAKITPIDDDERKSFMHWATVTHNVYSLGRFATWRPNLLLDDLINDIRKIDKWIGSTNKYDTARDR
jgi:sporulation protein YlmC with PRC-barrel domain